jgi:hypothetical protein
MAHSISPWVGIGVTIALNGLYLVIVGLYFGRGGLFTIGAITIPVSLWLADGAQKRHRDRKNQRDEQLAAIWAEIEKEPPEE